MPTDGQHTLLYNKKLLPLQSIKDQWKDYMLNEMRAIHKDVYSVDAAIGSLIPVTASTVANMIDIAKTSLIAGVTGSGRRIVTTANADSRMQGVKIPPNAGTVYNVGIEQNDCESGIETNPRTGKYQYSYYTELPGRVGVPSSVTDNGNGTLTINVNSLVESGDDHSGRMVRVWLKSAENGGPGPQSSSSAVAIQSIAITYSAPNNTILVPNTLGQAVASTTVTDYMIQLIGPTVKRVATENLQNTAGCLFLASVISVAAANLITTIDTTGQRVAKYSVAQVTAEGTWIVPGGTMTFNTNSVAYTAGFGGMIYPADIGGTGKNPLCSFPNLQGKRITEVRMYVIPQANTNVKMRLAGNVKATGLPTGNTDSALASTAGVRTVLTLTGLTIDIDGSTWWACMAISGGTVANNVTIEAVEFDYIPIP